MSTFIETQFPIARLSAESYKERKANNGQTLTRLGKWWGRKPLILARAAVVGMLMPASDNPKKDREIFLKILTMDDDGAWRRCKGEIPVAAWRDAAPEEIREEYFSARGFNRGMTKEEKDKVACKYGKRFRPNSKGHWMRSESVPSTAVLNSTLFPTPKESTTATAPRTSQAQPKRRGWRLIAIWGPGRLV